MDMKEIYEKTVTKVHNKILAIGKNYHAHVKEMGGTDFPEEPVIFQKPMTSLIYTDDFMKLPSHKRPIHHEIELGFMISQAIKDAKADDWQKYVGGYFLAVDFTDRDFQAKAKKFGFPWDLSKGQDGFCPISKMIPVENIKDPHNLDISLKINDKIVQEGNTELQHFRIPFLIEYLSKFMTLNCGDLILTGTPCGVGPVKSGDKLLGELKQEGKLIQELSFTIKE